MTLSNEELIIKILKKDRGFYKGIEQVYMPLVDDLSALIADKVAEALINEWEQIDGDDTHYWDYRENGRATEKVYLSPTQRMDELQAQLQHPTKPESDDTKDNISKGA